MLGRGEKMRVIRGVFGKQDFKKIDKKMERINEKFNVILELRDMMKETEETLKEELDIALKRTMENVKYKLERLMEKEKENMLKMMKIENPQKEKIMGLSDEKFDELIKLEFEKIKYQELENIVANALIRLENAIDGADIRKRTEYFLKALALSSRGFIEFGNNTGKKQEIEQREITNAEKIILEKLRHIGKKLDEIKKQETEFFKGLIRI